MGRYSELKEQSQVNRAYGLGKAPNSVVHLLPSLDVLCHNPL